MELLWSVDVSWIDMVQSQGGRELTVTTSTCLISPAVLQSFIRQLGVTDARLPQFIISGLTLFLCHYKVLQWPRPGVIAAGLTCRCPQLEWELDS